MNRQRPSKRLTISFPCINALAFLACVSILCPQSSATTLVIIGTRHGVVIGADGKTVQLETHGQFQPESSAVRTKIVLIGNRIAIADVGIDSIGNGTATFYSFSSLVKYLQSKTSPQITIKEVVALIEREIPLMFHGFDDAMLKSGLLRRDSLPPGGDTLLQLYIASYVRGNPQVYRVNLDIDWNALHLTDPIETTVYPTPRRQNLSLDYIGGPRGISALGTQINTDQIRIAWQNMPIELNALFQDSDINLDQMLTLTRGLLDLEVQSDPITYGYPLTIYALGESGPKKYTYNSQKH